MKRIKIEGKKPDNKPSNKSIHLTYQPFALNMSLNLKSLDIVKHLLKGTESNEWLLLAEKKAYERLKK